MIYVIAAYTITLSTLALYWVFLQHRVLVFGSEQDVLSTQTANGRPRGFNVGAALLTPLWMWSHGMRLPGAALLVVWLAMVPLFDREMWALLLFVAIVPFAAGVALGLVGNRIAVGHRSAESVAEFSASQLPWATAGVALYAIVLPWTWYFLYAAG